MTVGAADCCSHDHEFQVMEVLLKYLLAVMQQDQENDLLNDSNSMKIYAFELVIVLDVVVVVQRDDIDDPVQTTHQQTNLMVAALMIEKR